jgi:predicted Zn-dependent protease
VVEFDAVYFDGHSSARHKVHARGDAQRLALSGDGVDIVVSLADARWEPPVSAGKRHALRLASGAQLQTEDGAALAALLPGAPKAHGMLQKLERRWSYALGAFAVIALFATLAIVYGVPIAAKHVAYALPPEMEGEIGSETLAAIDKMCAKSALSDARQQEIRERLAKLTAGIEGTYRIEFRSCGIDIGPNAFALPGAIIVVTDDIVTLAQTPGELSSVLSHEVGHVLHRHSTRQALQAAGVAALVTALAGDAVSITGLAAAVPTVLLESGYSRQFEEEADDFAFRRMKEVGLSPRDFARMMSRLEDVEARRHAASKAKGETRVLDYLSTHPATRKRIERALAAEGGQ